MSNKNRAQELAEQIAMDIHDIVWETFPDNSEAEFRKKVYEYITNYFDGAASAAV